MNPEIAAWTPLSKATFSRVRRRRDRRLPETAEAIIHADESAWNQSRQSILDNLRKAIAFPGSLKDEIGFLDRADDEIRGFLSSVVVRASAQVPQATPAASSSLTEPPTAGSAGTT